MWSEDLDRGDYRASWIGWCFGVTALCGFIASCIPNGDESISTASPSDLASLDLSVGPLQPVFASATMTYVVLAPNSASSTMVTATTSDPAAKLLINNQPAVSGQAYGPIALDPDVAASTPISLVVEPPGTAAPKSYTVLVARAGNADLAALTVTPGSMVPVFNPDMLSYRVDVANSVTSVTLRATVQDATSTLTINGGASASGAPYVVTGFPVGDTTVRIRVRAAGGAVQDYVVTIGRAGAPSTDSTVSSMQVSATVVGTNRPLVLCPSFSPSVSNYSVTPVPSATTTVAIAAVPSQGSATVRINGQQVSSGVPLSVPVSVGNTTVPVDVTAQAGNTRRYTLTVNRATTPSSNNSLWALAVSAGPLSPVFCHSNTSYAVTTTQASMTVTATVADPTATLRVNGTVTVSGLPSASIPLAKGKNTVTVSVTAQNGSVLTYAVAVNRS